MSRIERGISQEVPEGARDTQISGEEVKIHFSPWFSDFAELTSANYSPFEYAKVAIVQEIRRRPKLQKRIEDVARKLGREVDLSKRL